MVYPHLCKPILYILVFTNLNIAGDTMVIRAILVLHCEIVMICRVTVYDPSVRLNSIIGCSHITCTVKSDCPCRLSPLVKCVDHNPSRLCLFQDSAICALRIHTNVVWRVDSISSWLIYRMKVYDTYSNMYLTLTESPVPSELLELDVVIVYKHRQSIHAPNAAFKTLPDQLSTIRWES